MNSREFVRAYTRCNYESIETRNYRCYNQFRECRCSNEMKFDTFNANYSEKRKRSFVPKNRLLNALVHQLLIYILIVSNLMTDVSRINYVNVANKSRRRFIFPSGSSIRASL